jgi:5-methylthioadenosine/S-adenosylhomocysteine deaminase
MPVVPADLRIEVRWIAPMTARNQILEHHSLMVRDGRVLDILPTPIATQRYFATAVLQRPTHLLMPGMINSQADAAEMLGAERFAGLDLVRDSVLLAIAQMLKSGITCFSDRHYFPETTARIASEQGIRAVVGMPVTEAPTPWAKNAADSLTRSLNLRDQWRDDPLVSTLFAPRAANSLSDATFSRLATMADELDAGILIDLHQSAAEISECLAAHGVRPIERLEKLGLLSPALNGVHMVQVTAADISLAQRTGITITLCPQADLKLGNGLPPIGAFAAAKIPLGLGSVGAVSLTRELWGDIKLIALASHSAGPDGVALNTWDALEMATRGGAAVLGLDSQIGTLQAGQWADMCCLDLSGPSTQPLFEPLAQLVFSGGRDIVSDVWVAGRQLLSGGELTRLDWADTAARSKAWAARMNSGE